jgi:hypothetical protein
MQTLRGVCPVACSWSALFESCLGLARLGQAEGCEMQHVTEIQFVNFEASSGLAAASHGLTPGSRVTRETCTRRWPLFLLPVPQRNARTPCLESKLNFSLAIRNLGADHEATTCVQRRFSTLPQCRLCQHTAFAIDSYSAQSVLVLICRPILLRKRKLSLILPGSCDLDQHQRWFQKDSSMALMSNFVEHL